jgi:hypothetical protein
LFIPPQRAVILSEAKDLRSQPSRILNTSPSIPKMERHSNT